MKKTAALFLLGVLAVAAPAFCQSDVRILVRGQEIAFGTLTLQNNIPVISADDPALAQVSNLFGRENSPVPPSVGNRKLSLPDLAKQYNASLTYDSDRNIWYVDPWINGVSIQTAPNGSAVQIQSSVPVQPTVTRLEDPPRIVLDFPYAALSQAVSLPAQEAQGLVRKVEVAQFQAKPNVVRVVVSVSQKSFQWNTEVNPQSKALSVVVSPLVSRVYGQAGPSEKATLSSPAILGPVQLKMITGPGGAPESAADLEVSVALVYGWKKLRSPDNRVYIDFLNCLQGAARTLDVDNPYFGVIRVAQFQRKPVPVVRVVFQLKQPFHVEVAGSAGGLRVTVSSRLEDAGEVLSGGGTTGFSAALALGGKGFSPFSAAAPNGIVIVLDPGHGGSDPGARGTVLVEKNVTLDIAERLRGMLAAKGFTVVMTRTGDEDVLGYHGSAKAELQARVDAAARSGAAMFVSLHINSSDYSWPHGIQSHWYKSADLPLATLIQRQLSRVPGFVDRGVMRDRFYVLHHTAVPATLVELGFISNPGDEAQLEKSSVRDELAEAVSRGIVEYAAARKMNIARVKRKNVSQDADR